MAEVDTAERLQNWIHAHRACWEMALLPGPRGEEEHRPLELTLLAQCSARCGVDPGHPECRAVYERLAEIAARVVPPSVTRHVEPFDACVRLRPESAFHAEAELVVEVLTPPDDLEAVRHRLEEALALLGVQAHAWSEEIRVQAGRVRKSASQLGIVV